MADFRRKEYRGSLLLVQECGPVDIVVDTEDKTVTPTLAKADTEYSIAGGGGSLEYVIPEQTVTFTGTGEERQEISGFVQYDGTLIAKYTLYGEADGEPFAQSYYIGQEYDDDSQIYYPTTSILWTDEKSYSPQIQIIDNKAYLCFWDDLAESINGNVTVSAIKAPF